MGPDGSNDTPALLLELAGEGVMEKGIEMGGGEGRETRCSTCSWTTGNHNVAIITRDEVMG